MISALDRASTIQDRAGNTYTLVWFPIASAWWIRSDSRMWTLLNDNGKITEDHTRE